MSSRRYTFAEDEYYHIYNRGNSRQEIFHKEEDYQRFLKLLYAANGSSGFVIRDLDDDEVFSWDRGEPQVHVGAYCLMPNHFHILLTPAQKDGVSKFMLKLGTGIAYYINKKYNRTGTLFEGPFKAKHVDSDPYLKYLFAYIHLNPFRTEAENHPHSTYNKEKLLSYTHSSLPDYLEMGRPQQSILSKQKFPQYFETVDKNLRELREWLDFTEELPLTEATPL